MTETREIVVRLQLEYPPGQAPGPTAAAVADQPLLYRVPEVARLLAIGESAVNELIARGEIESVKIGSSRRITRAGVETYVRRLARGDGDVA
jgi:excisionase family DNA binding protein